MLDYSDNLFDQLANLIEFENINLGRLGTNIVDVQMDQFQLFEQLHNTINLPKNFNKYIIGIKQNNATFNN